MKVLIVENGSNNIDLVANIIQNLEPNANILVAKNGEEGLLDAWFHQPDVIITGLTLPKMDGYEMVRLLRLEQTGRRMPIIGLCPNSGGRVAQFCEICDECLASPLDRKQLRTTLKTWLPQQQKPRSSGLDINPRNMLWSKT